MSSRVWKSVISKHCYNLCDPKINKFLATHTKFYSKKQYRMKNKFNFREDLKKNSLENSNNKISSSSLFSESNDYDVENNNSNFIHGFVSRDLLSQDLNRNQRKIV